MVRKIKAVALWSGGLDSILAVKLIVEQGNVTVHPVRFITPFSESRAVNNATKASGGILKDSGLIFETISLGKEYLRIIRNPEYGYGKNMNPCIDCRIYMLKEAKKYLGQLGGSFLITGEVLGQRPMSQTGQAIQLIEKRAGVAGLVLRPLCAKLLEPTLAEEKGWVDRSKLLALSGRSRRTQFELAGAMNLGDFPSPAGGCLLTDPGFSLRLKDLFDCEEINLGAIELLKIGRHFRFSPEVKLVVSRNKDENEKLLLLAQDKDFLFSAVDFPGPLALGRGEELEKFLSLAGSITARYGKARHSRQAKVSCRRLPEQREKFIFVKPAEDKELSKYRI